MSWLSLRNIIPFISLFILADLSTLPLWAEDQGNFFTLERSIQEALQNSLTIKAKQERIERSQFIKEQAKTDFAPKLSTAYTYTRLSEKKDPVIGDLNSRDNYKWDLIFTQPLFTGFALTSSYKLSELGIDASLIELELAQLDLVLEVKQAYFDILKADRSMEVAEKAVEQLQSHLEVAQSFYKVGMNSVNEVLKAEVELANAQHDLIAAQNKSKLARSVFNNKLARGVDLPVMVEDILSYHPIEGDYNQYLTKALEKRPEIKTLDINIQQSEQQIRLAKSKYYPEVTAQYTYTKEGDHPDVHGSEYHEGNSWRAMVGLSWLLVDFGKTRNAAYEKESLKKELMIMRSEAVENLGLNIKQAMLDLEEADKKIAPTQKAVEQAEENLRVSQERYKAQVTTSTEVLDAQTLLTQARMNYYNALYNHILAKAKLQRAVGER